MYFDIRKFIFLYKKFGNKELRFLNEGNLGERLQDLDGG